VDKLRRATLIAVSICALAILFGASLMNGSAYNLDSTHWRGKALPPCFIEAINCGGHRAMVGRRLSWRSAASHSVVHRCR
jgi:hypothetical protein